MTGRILAGTLAAVLTLAAPCLAGPDEEKKKEPEKKEEAAKEEEAGKEGEAAKKAPAKPRVITNEDLEKYGKGGGAERPGARPAPPPVSDPPAAEVPPPPPEERLDGSATPSELRSREAELAGLLDYLEKKERWLLNPFGRPPTPPPGEPLVDPAHTGAMELSKTRQRIDDTANRLHTIRGMIRALETPR